QQMEGSIWVYSEPGKGSTFKILFPVAESVDRAEQAAAQAAAPASGEERILLVEDEPGVRKFVRAMLEKQGYSVIDSVDTDEALRIAADERVAIDLLLTDV